jgi:hypothetical protein
MLLTKHHIVPIISLRTGTRTRVEASIKDFIKICHALFLTCHSNPKCKQEGESLFLLSA